MFMIFVASLFIQELNTQKIPHSILLSEGVQDFWASHDGVVYIDGIEDRVFFSNEEKGIKKVLGNKGEGPGEYLLPTCVYLNAGIVKVFDPRLGKVITYSVDGTFISEFKVHGSFQATFFEKKTVILTPFQKTLLKVYSHEGELLESMGEAINQSILNAKMIAEKELLMTSFSDDQVLLVKKNGSEIQMFNVSTAPTKSVVYPLTLRRFSETPKLSIHDNGLIQVVNGSPVKSVAVADGEVFLLVKDEKKSNKTYIVRWNPVNKEEHLTVIDNEFTNAFEISGGAILYSNEGSRLGFISSEGYVQ